jgi:hypothetical protein
MKPRDIIAITICCLTAILTAPASSRAQQTQPGPPAGTPGKYSTQPAQQGKAGATASANKGTTTTAGKGATTKAGNTARYRLSFAVVDFEVSTELSAARADLGGKIADAFATSLREHGAGPVVRKAVVLSAADLADPARTRDLRYELDADVVVGGQLQGLGKELTVESIRTKDGQLLATSKSDIPEIPASQGIEFWTAKDANQTDLAALVTEVRSPAYLLRNGSDKEVPIVHAFQFLHAGDRVRCGKGGGLALEIDGVVIHIEPSDKWFTVTAATGSAPADELLDQVSAKIYGESVTHYYIVTPR